MVREGAETYSGISRIFGPNFATEMLRTMPDFRASFRALFLDRETTETSPKISASCQLKTTMQSHGINLQKFSGEWSR